MAANSFLFEMVPIYMGGNNENDRVTSPESVSIHLNVNWYIFQESFSAIVFQWGSKLKGKNLLFYEQIITFKSTPILEGYVSQGSSINYKLFPFEKVAEKKEKKNMVVYTSMPEIFAVLPKFKTVYLQRRERLRNPNFKSHS